MSARGTLPAAETTFLDRKTQALLVTLPKNERPLLGLASRMDWKLQGILSRFIKKGALNGDAGELTYIPTNSLHLFVLGIGNVPKPGARPGLDHEKLKLVSKKIRSLNIKSLTISQHDLGESTESKTSKEALEKLFSGIELCLTE